MRPLSDSVSKHRVSAPVFSGNSFETPAPAPSPVLESAGVRRRVGGTTRGCLKARLMVIFNDYTQHSPLIEINRVVQNFTVLGGEKIISFARDYQVINFF